MPLLETVQSAITQVPTVEQFFLNPLGLLGLLALIPLAFFYLVKPKPEEQVMPSMRFFQQEDGSSQLRRALRTILRNLVLLLQVLAVIGFAAALANPFINTFEQPESSVIVLDRSGSMEGEMEEAKRFLESRLGEKNTLIVVDSEVEVKAERVPPSRIREILERIESVDTETDIATAVDASRNYRGRLVIASDLDQTVDDRDLEEVLTSASSKPVDVMEAGEGNSWGFTDVQVSRNTTLVEVSSFTENVTIEVAQGEQVRHVSLAKGETARLRFESREGRNTVELPQDGMKADNTLRYVVPDADTIRVRYLGPENRYFETAVELISGAEMVSNSSESVDVYVIGGKVEETGELQQIASEVEDGASAVVFRESRALGETFDFETSPKEANRSVKLRYPQRIDLGRTEVLDRGIEGGKSLSVPGSAFKIHRYGEGKILAYNIDDSDFRTDFLYPVFWEAALARISGKPTVQELNLETGQQLEAERLEAPSGRRYEGNVELNETGFYTSSGTVYAVNLLSTDESSPEGVDYETSNRRELEKTRKSVQSFATLLLAALIGVELAYLWYRGDL